MASNNDALERIYALLPDNDEQEISARDTRDSFTITFDNKEEFITKLEKISDLPTHNSKIFEGSVVTIYDDRANTGVYVSKINQPLDINDLYLVSNSSDSGIKVIDNLNSYSPDDALSANQGRVLDGKKEDNLGNPTQNGMVLSSTTTGVRSWIEMNSAEWGNITGDINNQTDLINQLNSKADVGHLHQISDITDLQSTLDEKANITEIYLRSQFINTSAGTPDAGKPIVLNQQGQIDVSMLDTSTFYYVGPWDPSAGDEYPDTTGESFGAFWVVDQISIPNSGSDYEFQAGELAGKTITVGDFMVWGTGGWGIMAGEMNPTLYYKLDGSQSISAPFAGGGQQFKNAADGSDNTDLVTKQQLDTKISKSGDTISGPLLVDDGSTVKTRLVPFGLEMLNQTGSNEMEFIFDPVSTVVDFKFNTDISLSVFAGSAPGTKYQPTQDNHLTRKDYIDNAISGKENYLGVPLQDGMVLSSLMDGTRSWVTVTSAEWGNITGDINNQNDLFLTFEEDLGVPTQNAQILASNIDGSRYWTTIQNDEAVWGNITGDIDNQTDLMAELDTKLDRIGGVVEGYLFIDTGSLLGLKSYQATTQPELEVAYWYYNSVGIPSMGINEPAISFYCGDENDSVTHPGTLGLYVYSNNDYQKIYTEENFIDYSSGTADAGKPIKLNSEGQIDASMLEVSTFYYVGPWDPSVGNEYPDTTGQTPGAFWVVDQIAFPNNGTYYDFQSGDLAGLTISVGDFMVWGAGGWGIMRGEMNPMLYYKLDGTNPLLADFNGGGFNIGNINDPVDFESQPDNQGATVGQLKRLAPDDIGAAPEIHDHEISDVNGLQPELDSKLEEVPGAAIDTMGGFKMRLDSSTNTVYLTTDGSQP